MAGGLQCFAFLISTWDIHTKTSPMLYPMYCWRLEVTDGLSWPGCGLAAVPAPVQSVEEVDALEMLRGSSKPWLVSPSPAQSLFPASSKTQRGPGVALVSRLASPGLTHCLCQRSCSASRMQLMPKGSSPRGCPALAAQPACPSTAEAVRAVLATPLLWMGSS